MKKGILNISAVLMSCIMLFSTLSLVIEKHICAGEVADVAVFGNLERCGIPDENHTNILGFSKESCCQDEVQFVEGVNADLKVSQKTQAQPELIAALFTYSYLNLFNSIDRRANSFLSYSPPIVVKDIQVLYDTFLI